MIDAQRSFLQTARRQRNIAGNHDITGFDTLDDVIIRLIQAIADDHLFDKRMLQSAYPPIADRRDGKTVTLGDTQRLLFDGTGIGVDENTQRLK